MRFSLAPRAYFPSSHLNQHAADKRWWRHTLGASPPNLRPAGRRPSPIGATTFTADKRHLDGHEDTLRGAQWRKRSDTFDKARSTFPPGTPAADCFDATLRANFQGRSRLVSARACIFYSTGPRPKLLLNIRITPPKRGERYLEISTP